MNSLENSIKANSFKIKSLVAEIEERATENNLDDFVQKINPSLAPSSPDVKYNFNDAHNKSWDNGWGNYGKS